MTGFINLSRGREASAILADMVKTPRGFERVQLARLEAKDWVDARTRSGIPLERFTEEEMAEWEAEEELLYEGTGIQPRFWRDFHGDVDFIH